jgi:ABC-2 type transport system permease protein
MRSVFLMAAKDLKLISRDWVGMFFIVGFPVLMGVFFGSIMGQSSSGSASLSVAVVDEDESEMSAKFIDALTATGNVEVSRLARDEAKNDVRRGKFVGMIAIPKGYGETAGILWEEGPAIQVGIDPSRRAEAGMLNGLIMQASGQLMSARFQDPAALRPFIAEARAQFESAEDLPLVMRPLLSQMMNSLDDFMASLEEVQAAETETETETETDEADSNVPQMQLARIESIDVAREIPKDSPRAAMQKVRSAWDISFPQSMMWGVLACAATFAITIVRERKQGTLLRLKVAPITRNQILAGKGFACFVAVVGVVSMMILVGYLLGMRPRNPAFLVLATFCTAFCFVGIMMLMSVIGKSEEAVSGAAWGANVIMAMFGGGMIPLAFMPGFLKTLSNISPVKWSILAMEGAIWRGFSLLEMLLPCGVLTVVGLTCLTVGCAVLSRSTD